MAAPRPRGISDIMPKLQNVSLSSQFLVKFALPRGDCRTYLRSKGVNDRFIADDVGLLCTDAVLPGSALASVNTTGDFQGLTERFAHTRQFTQVSFEFYVDNEYRSLKFLEHWIDFIASGSIADPSSDTYHFKMKYPQEYKSNDTRVVKFERNHSQFLEYRFIGMFPISLNSTRVSYNNSQILKASAQFSFDRYVCGESSSLSRALGIDLNNQRGKDRAASLFTARKNASSLSRVVNASKNILNQGIGYNYKQNNQPPSKNPTPSSIRF